MPFNVLADLHIRTQQIFFPATDAAVREVLCNVFDEKINTLLSTEACDTAQLVLAEALNNIVKHAYAASTGRIELNLGMHHDRLEVHIADDGLPMPEGDLPDGNAHQVLGDCDDLPEGGFGWVLIRALSHNLNYRREEGRNFLSFSINHPSSA